MINLHKKTIVRFILSVCVFGIFLLSSVPATLAAPAVAPQSVLAAQLNIEGGDHLQGNVNRTLGREHLGELNRETQGTLIEEKGKTQAASEKAKKSLDRVSSQPENHTEKSAPGLIGKIKNLFK
ncbi:hypothetical protein H6G20_02955 [Desertifilum sp. FACHB-1129]|uniref:Low temperature-induced protein n=1 Tax=Desertifilum tharense IPPAS B-1220 TaxID=1781255 RepID=A0A1E5QPS2_9CYAN|nr:MULTISPECIES: hypothetical protein [Desertifilum]MDA0209873.1 hypothetical protein [Cyanobacteria bacterium FC1]MBD2310637.1 hypothetical protein [Desertifilum sp. FACHB-1129]MBD2320674.1 hypothetical protein [Desertifilum sp. FACHB-866]MBD2330802.1 hypothetical protein [Desertifilum sp. FACHB-868]OEJ76648.1 hypothetical protein BH720_03585 [Desertifilum tharense IPPAS B-1220]